MIKKNIQEKMLHRKRKMTVKDIYNNVLNDRRFRGESNKNKKEKRGKTGLTHPQEEKCVCLMDV